MTKRITWKIEKRKLSDLKPHSKNPRQFTEKGLKDLENSINSIGFMQPININQDGTILSGHARAMKLKEMDELEVDVYVPDRMLTPKQEEEVLVRANANTAGQWDFDILANEFEIDEITDWGLEVPNMEIETEELEPAEIKEDEVPEVKHNFVVKGDLFELVDEEQGLTHRVLCGDSTMIDDVEKVMNGEKADMVFTDPPYGMFLDVSNSNKVQPKGTWKNKPKNYNKVSGDNEDFSPDFINNIFAFFSDVKEIFIWGADYFAELIINRNNGSWVVWDKRTSVESVEYTGSHFELCWSKNKHNRDIARIPWFGIIGIEQEFDRKRQHPTQKPINLAIWFFKKWGKENDLVADLYLGSGSTLIACQQTKRKCYGIELDEHYCGVIVKRWINYMQKENKSFKIKRNNEDFDINEIEGF